MTIYTLLNVMETWRARRCEKGVKMVFLPPGKVFLAEMRNGWFLGKVTSTDC
jgi:hypothetical protein